MGESAGGFCVGYHMISPRYVYNVREDTQKVFFLVVGFTLPTLMAHGPCHFLFFVL